MINSSVGFKLRSCLIQLCLMTNSQPSTESAPRPTCIENNDFFTRPAAYIYIFVFYRHILRICCRRRHIRLQATAKRLVQQGFFQLGQGGEFLLVEGF